MAFGAYRALISRVQRLNVDRLMEDVWDDRTLQAQVLDLNTESQLYAMGVDSAGNPLSPPYAPMTIQYKRAMGQRYDHVTLKDSGNFYRSFRFIQDRDGFRISADTSVEGGRDLAEDYGEKIIGLTDESINELIPEIRERMREQTRRALAG